MKDGKSIKDKVEETRKELGIDLPEDVRDFVDLEEYQKMLTRASPTPHQGEYIFPEISFDELADTLSSTIVKDRTPKLLTFMVNLLTYTEEDQAGILYQAGGSTGKSHNALEVTKGYFPEEDIIGKDYVSPTAFFHNRARLCIRRDYDEFYPIISRRAYVSKKMKQWLKENPKPESGYNEWRERKRAAKARFKEKWNKLEKVNFNDLSRKILLFKDMPHDLVLQNLRPMTSHDERIFEASITDKSSSGQHSTKNVMLRGFATFLFISASYSQSKQERSRFFLMSPDLEQDKVRGAVKMGIRKNGDKPTFMSKLEQNEDRQALRERVKAIRDQHIRYIVFTPELQKYIEKKVFKNHTEPQPRLMRDVPRMMSLMKAHALLNFNHRERREAGILIATKEDVDAGFELYEPIAQANEHGVPPQIYDFYEETLKPTIEERIEEGLTEGITRKEFTKLWFDKFREQIGYKRIKDIIYLMDNAGLASEKQDPNDGRRKIIYIPTLGVDVSRVEPSKQSDKNEDIENIIETFDGYVPAHYEYLLKSDVGDYFEPAQKDMKHIFKLQEEELIQEREEQLGTYEITDKGRTKLRELKGGA